MNTVEKIEAAIVKFEALKAASTPGPWTADVGVRGDCVLWGPRGKFLANIETDRRTEPSLVDWEGKQSVMFDCDRNDALLMEALHRTIDAQLAILRFGVQRLNAVRVLTGKHAEAHAHELALADAILGGVS